MIFFVILLRKGMLWYIFIEHFEANTKLSTSKKKQKIIYKRFFYFRHNENYN